MTLGPGPRDGPRTDGERGVERGTEGVTERGVARVVERGVDTKVSGWGRERLERPSSPSDPGVGREGEDWRIAREPLPVLPEVEARPVRSARDPSEKLRDLSRRL